MKRLLTSALAAALVVAGTGRETQAQDATVRSASLFDLGVYAGGAYTSSWFEINNDGYKPGLSGIFGAQATYWATPSFGVRLNGAYMPANLPRTGGGGTNDWAMNNWFYDLDLVLRPWFWNTGMSPWMSSMYLFLGGGGLTTNVAGNPPAPRAGGFACVASYVRSGICVPYDPEYGSVGQGTAGLGVDLFPITPGIGLFAELGLHGYDSPAHEVGGANRTGTDKYALTTRLVAGLKFSFGNILPPPPPPPPVAPPPVVAPPVAPPPPPAPVTQDITVCVLQGNQLTNVTATFNPATGDTTVAGGQTFAAAYPATTGYAAGATWFINGDSITFNGRRYVRFGLSRVVATTDVTAIGEFQGVPVFAEATAGGTGTGGGMGTGGAGTGGAGAGGRGNQGPTPEVIYIPVRPGCEFQPYQLQQRVRTVRG